MLIGNNLRVKAQLKARLSHTIVDFIVFGSCKPLIKSADGFKYLPAVRCVKHGFHIAFAGVVAVRCNA